MRVRASELLLVSSAYILSQTNAADFGWVDAPPACASLCGPLLLCCNRHPRQKRALRMSICLLVCLFASHAFRAAGAFVAERARREREKSARVSPAPGCGSAVGRALCFRRRGPQSVPSATQGPSARVDDVAALYAEVEGGSTEHAALRCGPRHAVSVRAILAHTVIVCWLGFTMFYIILFGQYANDAVASSLLKSWAINLTISLLLVEVRSCRGKRVP